MQTCYCLLILCLTVGRDLMGHKGLLLKYEWFVSR